MKHDLYVHAITSGALRSKWEFEYGAQELALAAGKQAADRAARRDRWKAKYAEVMAKIKESGVSVAESVASSLSNTTYGRGPDVTVDDKLRVDLLECHGRIENHDKAFEEYTAWAAVMKAQDDRKLKLTQADWLFFFGGLDTTE